MTSHTAPRREVPQAEIDAVIDFLMPLSDDRYANRLADVVLCPEKGEAPEVLDRINDVFGDEAPEPLARDAAQAAFRSEKLVNRSHIAARYLIDHANAMMKTREGVDRKTDKRTLVFISKVGRERRILEQILSGLRAQRGFLDTTPNPKARAMQDLWQAALKGDVPAGTAQQFLAERTEEAAERKRRQKREAKDRARQRKASLSC